MMEDPFRSHLLENEHILWTGTPDPMAFALTFDSLVRAGTGLVLIAVLAFGPSVSVSSPEVGAALSFCRVLFLLLGLWTALTPLLRYNDGRGVAYAVTGQRVLLSRGFGRRVTALAPHQIERLEKRPRGHRRGDVVLSRRIVQGVEGWRTAEQALIAIEDHERVARIIAERLLEPAGDQAGA